VVNDIPKKFVLVIFSLRKRKAKIAVKAGYALAIGEISEAGPLLKAM
jgi:hypothetical protein